MRAGTFLVNGKKTVLPLVFSVVCISELFLFRQSTACRTFESARNKNWKKQENTNFPLYVRKKNNLHFIATN